MQSQNVKKHEISPLDLIPTLSSSALKSLPIEDSNYNSFRNMVARKRAEVNDISQNRKHLSVSSLHTNNATTASTSKPVPQIDRTGNTSSSTSQINTVNLKKRSSHPTLPTQQAATNPAMLSRAVLRGIPAPLSTLSPIYHSNIHDSSTENHTTHKVHKSMPNLNSNYMNISQQKPKPSEKKVSKHPSSEKNKPQVSNRPVSARAFSATKKSVKQSPTTDQIRKKDKTVTVNTKSRPQSASSTMGSRRATIHNIAEPTASKRYRKQSDSGIGVHEKLPVQSRMSHEEMKASIAMASFSRSRSRELSESKSGDISEPEIYESHQTTEPEKEMIVKREYSLSPFQVGRCIYFKIHPNFDETENYHQHQRYKASDFRLIQSYLFHPKAVINMELLAAICHRVKKNYRVLETNFYCNEKIVDADVQGLLVNQDDPNRSFTIHELIIPGMKEETQPSNAIKLINEWIERESPVINNTEPNSINPTFQIIISPTESNSKVQLTFVSSNAVADEFSCYCIAAEIFSMYTICAKIHERILRDSNTRSTPNDTKLLSGKAIALYSQETPNSVNNEKLSFVDFCDRNVFTKNEAKAALAFWHNMCIETIQETVGGSQRHEIEQQLKGMKTLGENLEKRIKGLKKRIKELGPELEILKWDRKKLEEDERIDNLSRNNLHVFVDNVTLEKFIIPPNVREVLLRTVLGEDAHKDNVYSLLDKHDVSDSVKLKLGVSEGKKMTIEDFAMLTDSHVEDLNLFTKDRKKLLALVEYVKNRIKECLQEQSKVKFGLERKIMKVQREYDNCLADLKSSQSGLESNEDVSQRLKLIIDPPAIESTIPILSLKDNYQNADEERKDDYSHSKPCFPNYEVFREITLQIDGELLESLRNFQETALTTLEYRAQSKGDLSTAKSISDSIYDEETEDGKSSTVSPRYVCLAAFAVLLKHVTGSDKFLLGVTQSFRQENLLVGPLTDTLPLKIDLKPDSKDSDSISFNDLFNNIYESMQRIKRMGFVCPMSKIADELNVGSEIFPIIFEYWGLNETKHFHDKGIDIINCLSNELRELDSDSNYSILWQTKRGPSSEFDLKLIFIEKADQIVAKFIFNKEKFSEDTVVRWVDKYHATISGIEYGARKILIKNLISRYYQSVWNLSSGSASNIANL
ncbi:hypothetical protein HK098_000346 [Nowakowskiella sp. JEL0407]|nr:hypothetical protein HK098_000346 [Nowakowskiella sp. JEL0407]